MRDLGAVSPGTVRDVVSGGGFGICTLGPVAWGRGLLGAVSIFVGALVAVVRGGGGARAGVLSKLLCTFGSISGGGGGYLGCVCGLDVNIFSIGEILLVRVGS